MRTAEEILADFTKKPWGKYGLETQDPLAAIRQAQVEALNHAKIVYRNVDWELGDELLAELIEKLKEES